MLSSSQSLGFQTTQAVSSRRVTPKIDLSVWYPVWNEKRKGKVTCPSQTHWLYTSLVLPFYGLKGVTLSCLNAKLGGGWEIRFQLSSTTPPPPQICHHEGKMRACHSLSSKDLLLMDTLFPTLRAQPWWISLSFPCSVFWHFSHWFFLKLFAFHFITFTFRQIYCYNWRLQYPPAGLGFIKQAQN